MNALRASLGLGSAFLLCGLLGPAPAAAAPLVPDLSGGLVAFDFEDGLQGWSTGGSVERVATGALGGAWAVFGDGLVITEHDVGDVVIGSLANVLFIEIDLTAVAWVELDQLYLGDASTATDFLTAATLHEIVPGVTIGEDVVVTSPDPLANPGRRRLDLRDHTGVRTLAIAWACFACPDFTTPLPGEPLAASGYVDAVTLIPEPGPAPLLVAGVVLLCSRRATSAASARGWASTQRPGSRA